MDSGNSGSLQSSSGGGGSDQEYDSRPFFNPLTHLNSISSNTQQQPPSFLLHHHPQQPTFFDPSSFHALSQSVSNPNPFLNLDAIHSQPLRSDVGSNGEDPLSSMQLRSLHDSNVRSSAPSDQNNHNHNGAPAPRKNPKKRTRASRRAPTTVLTTDTSNFRAKVQEFTGIPSPPFTATSYSRRLDLFGSVGLALRSPHFDGPAYPLRPSAQKSFLHHQNPPPINHESGFGAKFSQGSMMSLASVDGLGSGSCFSGGLTNNQDQVRHITASFDGNYNSSLNGCKLNFSSASTSDFLNDHKGLDNNVVPTRGAHEGTVDSWNICSSD
ncbi:uncharacterized protein LOC120009348 isoform X2 [Tripterygium wilfordii]|uniref:uncharacterized protein LOC120009348 isoform X2 n=1 Tax=Tripterygium wilfordii TaxID=458696 RepID=UPI0018F86199|nr:uncharacterized protein LOC120009348 isoform X2 [Tripterygium wilfordii]